MAERLSKLQSRFKAAFPAVAFFGGFFWDVFFLGRTITTFDLFLLLFYLAVSGVILLIMGRRGDPHGDLETHDDPETGPSGIAAAEGDPPKGIGKILHWMRSHGLIFALRFCYGGLFSALVIFYFLSSSYLPGFLTVIALGTLLCLNEFLESQYHRFTLTWSLFGICAILFLNFALPHLFHSIHPAWFFVSTSLGAGLVFLLKLFSPKAKGSLWPTLAMAAALILLYVCNAIPPVPLVKKELVVCRSLEKADGVYTARIELPAPWFFWRRSESVVRQLPGEKIFCFTSVFLPTGIECTLYHRWMYDDPRKKEWVEFSRIGFPIRGGRQDGFRGFTYKRNLAPGRWLIRVETERGRVLGTIRFRADSTTDSAMAYKNLILE